VEPGEVEAALRSHPAVTAAAVVAGEDDHGRRLVAYVVTAGMMQPSRSLLLEHLRSRLPEHLVPASFVTVDKLPLSPNGKLDRAALPAPESQADSESPYAAPRTATELVLADIWMTVLAVERVGVDDNFFSLGGESLLAAVLFAKTARRTGQDIPLSLLFSSPTIREMARVLDDEGGADDTSVVALRATGSKPPLFLVHGVSGQLFRYMHLVRRLDPGQPVYGLRPTDSFVASRRRFRIEDLAARYVDDILRTHSAGPYRLAGFCLGGVVALEVAHQLEELGHTVDVLALFDAEPPSSRPASRPRREAAQLASLVRRDESAAVYVRRRLANARTKTRSWPWLADHWLHVKTGRPLPNRWDDVERIRSMDASPRSRLLSRALERYVAPTTRCTLTMFRAGESTAGRTEVRFQPGGDGADESYVFDGPGVSHETLMEEPHVAKLADALTQRLDRADVD
jgi:thioesterase domain-containing protein